MKINEILKAKSFARAVIIIVVALILYAILRLIWFDADPIVFLFSTLFEHYIGLCELLANFLIKLFNVNVIIENHRIIFGDSSCYSEINGSIINNWTSYVLFKKWSFFIFLVIWLTFTSFKRKMIYSGLLLATHLISVLSGLLIISIIGPAAIDSDSPSQLNPNIIGALAMITILVIWIKWQKENIYKSLGLIGINKRISNHKINEVIVLFYIFSILKNFIVPFFNFYPYINFLLFLTSKAAALFGYTAEISNPYLVGEYGTLYMAKWCLGFVTMFVFAAIVYLTGSNHKKKWSFIVFGIILLHLLNIIRLTALFIFVQNNIDLQLALDHHNLYNIVFYTIVFVLWVIWIEKFVLKEKTKKLTKN